MHDATRSGLAAWESFYVIVGSSAATLTGLQFVVVALLAENRIRSTTREIDAFATPTRRGSFAWTSISGASVRDRCDALLLLFVGIHNAWDTVTYIALEQLWKPDAPSGPN
jgi:hypothetical protein